MLRGRKVILEPWEVMTDYHWVHVGLEHRDYDLLQLQRSYRAEELSFVFFSNKYSHCHNNGHQNLPSLPTLTTFHVSHNCSETDI